MPDVWPGWTTTEGSERSGDLIKIVDYDDAWPARFERWRQLLRSALGEKAVRIEHVGSTAVPGLAAKAIVDVQVSVADLDDESVYVPQIEAVGLQLRSRDELHRYFRPFGGALRDITSMSATSDPPGSGSICSSVTTCAGTSRRGMPTAARSVPPPRGGPTTASPTPTPRPRSFCSYSLRRRESQARQWAVGAWRVHASNARAIPERLAQT